MIVPYTTLIIRIRTITYQDGYISNERGRTNEQMNVMNQRSIKYNNPTFKISKSTINIRHTHTHTQ